MCARKSLSCASVYLFLGEYLRAPLGDHVCSLVVKMFVVLYFFYVLGCGYGLTGFRVCILLVCRSASLGGTSPHAWMGGNCLVVGVFGCWEVFLVYVFVPCFVDDL